MLEVILMACSLLAFCSLCRVVTGPVRIMSGNPFAPFVYMTLFFTLLGLGLVSLTRSRVNYLALVSPDTLLTTVIAVCYSLISFPLGMWAAASLCGGGSKHQIDAFVFAPIKWEGDGPASLRFASLLMAVLSAAIVTYVYVCLPAIPWLYLGSSPLRIAQARILATLSFGGIVHIRNILGLTFVPMASCIAYATYLAANTRGSRLVFWLSMVLSVLILTYNMAKMPVLLYMGSLFLTHVYTRGISASTKRRLVWFALLAMMLLTVMYGLIMGVSGTEALQVWNPKSPVFRVLFGQVQPLLLHFELFPKTLPFQYGASVGGFLRSGPAEIPARMVMRWVNPYGIEQGIAGFANSYYISEAWANFGLAGVILGPPLIGFIWYLLIHLITSKKTPVRAGLMGFVTIQFASISQASAIRFLYNPEIVVSAVLVLMCLLAGKAVAATLAKRRPRVREKRAVSM